MAQEFCRRYRYRFSKTQMRRQRLISSINGKSAAFRNDRRRIRQHLLQTPVVQSGRNDQYFQIVTQPLLHIQQQRQRGSACKLRS